MRQAQKDVKVMQQQNQEENPEMPVPTGEEIIKEIKSEVDSEVIKQIDKELKQLLNE